MDTRGNTGGERECVRGRSAPGANLKVPMNVVDARSRQVYSCGVAYSERRKVDLDEVHRK